MVDKANDKGGDHYKNDGYQHWDWAIDCGLGYLESAATKYVARWRRKGSPLEDLEKARNYVRKMEEAIQAPRIKAPEHGCKTAERVYATNRFILANDLDVQEAEVCCLLAFWQTWLDVDQAADILDDMLAGARAKPASVRPSSGGGEVVLLEGRPLLPGDRVSVAPAPLDSVESLCSDTSAPRSGTIAKPSRTSDGYYTLIMDSGEKLLVGEKRLRRLDEPSNPLPIPPLGGRPVLPGDTVFSSIHHVPPECAKIKGTVMRVESQEDGWYADVLFKPYSSKLGRLLSQTYRLPLGSLNHWRETVPVQDERFGEEA